PERPDADADPWAAKSMEPTKMVEAMVEAVEAEPMPSEPMPATPCMPDSRAAEEQRRQHNDDPRPLLLGPHGDPLPLIICGGALVLALDPVRWPFVADHLGHLPISHVNEVGQAHLTACPDGEGDEPFASIRTPVGLVKRCGAITWQ